MPQLPRQARECGTHSAPPRFGLVRMPQRIRRFPHRSQRHSGNHVALFVVSCPLHPWTQGRGRCCIAAFTELVFLRQELWLRRPGSSGVARGVSSSGCIPLPINAMNRALGMRALESLADAMFPPAQVVSEDRPTTVRHAGPSPDRRMMPPPGCRAVGLGMPPGALGCAVREYHRDTRRATD
jgi:hypothetical protein